MNGVTSARRASAPIVRERPGGRTVAVRLAAGALDGRARPVGGQVREPVARPPALAPLGELPSLQDLPWSASRRCQIGEVDVLDGQLGQRRGAPLEECLIERRVSRQQDAQRPAVAHDVMEDGQQRPLRSPRRTRRVRKAAVRVRGRTACAPPRAGRRSASRSLGQRQPAQVDHRQTPEAGERSGDDLPRLGPRLRGTSSAAPRAGDDLPKLALQGRRVEAPRQPQGRRARCTPRSPAPAGRGTTAAPGRTRAAPRYRRPAGAGPTAGSRQSPRRSPPPARRSPGAASSTRQSGARSLSKRLRTGSSISMPHPGTIRVTISE